MRTGPIARADGASEPAAAGGNSFVQAFLNEAGRTASASTASGRLIFALDATASRQPTWDMACGLQARMFGAVSDAGDLAVQLVYYRGHGECRASKWVIDTDALARTMSTIRCRAGMTQLSKVLRHAAREERADVLVFVGDAFEEDREAAMRLAGRLADRSVRAFMFQDGRDPAAEAVFREIATLTGGAYARFDVGAADELGRLLGAAARFAAAGRGGLRVDDRTERLLLEQLR